MYQSFQRPGENHNEMVCYLVDLFIQHDCRIIGVDLPYRIKPPVLYRPGFEKGHIPDVLAQKGNRYLIGEVETSKSILLPHTISQVLTFSSFSDASLVLCVPYSIKGNIPDFFLSRAEMVYYPSLTQSLQFCKKKQMW